MDTGNAGWTQMSLAEEEECREGDILHRIFENLVHQGARYAFMEKYRF